MAKNPISEGDRVPHSIVLRERTCMEISGVIEILAFDETQILLKTSCGCLRISGKNMHVTSLEPKENKALVEGTVDSLTYSAFRQKKPGFFKGIFS